MEVVLEVVRCWKWDGVGSDSENVTGSFSGSASASGSGMFVEAMVIGSVSVSVVIALVIVEMCGSRNGTKICSRTTGGVTSGEVCCGESHDGCGIQNGGW